MKVIFGVDRIFLVVVMGVMFDLIVGFVTLVVDVDVLFVVFAIDDVSLVVGEIIIGLVEGMGFFSFVCSLRICWKKIRIIDLVGFFIC